MRSYLLPVLPPITVGKQSSHGHSPLEPTHGARSPNHCQTKLMGNQCKAQFLDCLKKKNKKQPTTNRRFYSMKKNQSQASSSSRLVLAHNVTTDPQNVFLTSRTMQKTSLALVRCLEKEWEQYLYFKHAVKYASCKMLLAYTSIWKASALPNHISHFYCTVFGSVLSVWRA